MTKAKTSKPKDTFIPTASNAGKLGVGEPSPEMVQTALAIETQLKLPLGTLLAIARHESAQTFHPDVHPAGSTAVGIAQYMIPTWITSLNRFESQGKLAQSAMIPPEIQETITKGLTTVRGKMRGNVDWSDVKARQRELAAVPEIKDMLALRSDKTHLLPLLVKGLEVRELLDGMSKADHAALKKQGLSIGAFIYANHLGNAQEARQALHNPSSILGTSAAAQAANPGHYKESATAGDMLRSCHNAVGSWASKLALQYYGFSDQQAVSPRAPQTIKLADGKKLQVPLSLVVRQLDVDEKIALVKNPPKEQTDDAAFKATYGALQNLGYKFSPKNPPQSATDKSFLAAVESFRQRAGIPTPKHKQLDAYTVKAIADSQAQIDNIEAYRQAQESLPAYPPTAETIKMMKTNLITTGYANAPRKGKTVTDVADRDFYRSLNAFRRDQGLIRESQELDPMTIGLLHKAAHPTPKLVFSPAARFNLASAMPFMDNGQPWGNDVTPRFTDLAGLPTQSQVPSESFNYLASDSGFALAPEAMTALAAEPAPEPTPQEAAATAVEAAAQRAPAQRMASLPRPVM